MTGRKKRKKHEKKHDTKALITTTLGKMKMKDLTGGTTKSTVSLFHQHKARVGEVMRWGVVGACWGATMRDEKDVAITLYYPNNKATRIKGRIVSHSKSVGCADVLVQEVTNIPHPTEVEELWVPNIIVEEGGP